MATTYAIQLIHSDRGDWSEQLQLAVEEELKEVGLHRSVHVAVEEAEPSVDDPSVGVYLGSGTGVSDPGVERKIRRALHAGRVLIPVVEDLSSFSANVPPILAPANGIEWADAPRRLARRLLEELGIEDKQRRVFISHKREDGLWAAEQVYDALSHAGFTPFIDRFSIRSGERVQDAIADALEDHAFLLLLETPQAHNSEWVFDEVDYALSHTMGIVILHWPGNPDPVPGSKGLPRVTLSEADIRKDNGGSDVLTCGALDRVVAEVERAHAQGLCRRRRMLVRSVEEAARASGCTACLPLPGWRLHVSHTSQSTLVGITPRLPTARDLQLLDEARSDSREPTSALLVHSARMLSTELRRHLKWAVADRALALTPENAIGGWW